MTEVSFAGLTFADGGAHWILERGGLGGWFDTPPVRGVDTPRPVQHGSFGLAATRGARVVSVNVAVSCSSASDAESARDALASALADGSFGDLVVTSNAGKTTEARVRLNSATLIDWVPWSNTIRAQFELWAPDPLRYGPPESATTGFPVARGGLEYDLYTDGVVDTGFLEFGEASDTGRVVLHNPGTADVWPVFQVDGPVDDAGFDIAVVDTDRRIRFAGAVGAGSALVIDSASGTAVVDGVADRGGLLTFRDWFSIPAGGDVEVAFIPLGVNQGAELTAVTRPGFW